MQSSAPTDEEQAVTTRMRLNELSEKWSPAEGFPSESEMVEVVDLCRDLHDDLGDHIDTFVEDTPFTRGEATAWTLARYRDRRDCLLKDDAVAVVMTLFESSERLTKDGLSMSIEDWVTPGRVTELIESAESKYDQSKELLGTFRFPNREEVLHRPRLVWLDDRTLRRLDRQAKQDERYLDEVVNRLLDLTEHRRTLEGLIRAYLRARGRDNVAQVAIEESVLDASFISIVAHTGVQDALPEVVQETDIVTIAGEEYDLRFVEDSGGPHDFKRITVYASDSISGMDEVPLREGLAEARRAIEEVDRPSASPAAT